MKPVIEHIGLESANKSFHYFKREEAYYKPFWHYHPELELTFIDKGQGTRFIGDSILPYYDNDLVLIGSNVPHHWVSMKTQEMELQKAIVFQFPANLFLQFPECYEIQKLFEEANTGLRFNQPSSNLIKLIKGFDKVTPIEQIGLLIQILHQLEMDSQRSSLSSKQYAQRLKNDKNQSKISITTGFILENLDKKLTVDIMATQTNMVAQSFCRWFKNEIGHSFVTFLNMARVEQVSHQLITTDLPIQKIAFDCGFDSLSHFNRTFKKNKGKSPQAFRKGN